MCQVFETHKKYSRKIDIRTDKAWQYDDNGHCRVIRFQMPCIQNANERLLQITTGIFGNNRCKTINDRHKPRQYNFTDEPRGKHENFTDYRNTDLFDRMKKEKEQQKLRYCLQTSLLFAFCKCCI